MPKFTQEEINIIKNSLSTESRMELDGNSKPDYAKVGKIAGILRKIEIEVKLPTTLDEKTA